MVATSHMVRLDRAGNRLHRLLAVRLPVLAGSCSFWRWSRSSSACAGTSVPMRCDGLPECADAAGSEPDRRLMCAGRCYAMPCALTRMDRTVRLKVEYVTKSISATIGLQVGCLRPRVVRCFQLGSTVGLCSAGVVCDRLTGSSWRSSRPSSSRPPRHPPCSTGR